MAEPSLDARLETLRDYQILDSFPENRFERLTRLALRIFDVPSSTISLIDENRQWFKSHPGVEACETPLDVSFCKHALESSEVMVVLNAEKDPRFLRNRLVTGEPWIRFYAGAPLTAPSGIRFGTICVMDSIARRSFSAKEREILKDLAGLVVDELELRRAMLGPQELSPSWT